MIFIYTVPMGDNQDGLDTVLALPSFTSLTTTQHQAILTAVNSSNSSI